MANTSLTLGSIGSLSYNKKYQVGVTHRQVEVVRDALRALEENKANAKLNVLRSALIEGELSRDSGELKIHLQFKAKKDIKIFGSILNNE